MSSLVRTPSFAPAPGLVCNPGMEFYLFCLPPVDVLQLAIIPKKKSTFRRVRHCVGCTLPELAANISSALVIKKYLKLKHNHMILPHGPHGHGLPHL